jgi:hypothetical protein
VGLVAVFLSAVVACSSEGTSTDAAGGLGGIGGANGIDVAAAGGAIGSGGAATIDGAGPAGGASGGVGMDGGNGLGGSATDGGAPVGAVDAVDGGGVDIGVGAGVDGSSTGGRGGRGSGGAADGGAVASGGNAGSAGSGSGGRGRGGRGSGGAAGGGAVGSGGNAGSAGSGAGGRGSGGTVGTGGDSTAGTGPRILWTDKIQSNVPPWGLDGYGTEHPVGTEVTPSDSNGANFSVVPDPLGGAGLAIRHFAVFDTGGARSQGGLYGDVNTIFGNQAKKPEGIWVAQEWYFPEAISAGGDPYCWINLWDWHSINADRGNRWHTSPGLMLARDGSMRVVWEWGGPAANINQNSKYSSVAMPVGRWFDIEMHYVWSDTPTATLSLWIDGELVLEQSGVQTRDSSHQVVETYLKFYGSTQGRGPWVPTPSLKYTRNVRVAGERIWR